VDVLMLLGSSARVVSASTWGCAPVGENEEVKGRWRERKREVRGRGEVEREGEEVPTHEQLKD
jgi:hypothetical protein